jgi:hypothetical protein
MIWQSKRVLKSQKLWKKPNNIKNRPKGMSLEDWNAEVAEWKLNKLIVLDKVPKTRKQSKTSKDEE